MTSAALVILLNLASPLALSEEPEPEAAATTDEVAPVFDVASLLALEGVDVAVITNSGRNTTGLVVSVSVSTLVISTASGTETFTSSEVVRPTPLGDSLAPDAGTYGATRKHKVEKFKREAPFVFAFWDALAIAGMIIAPCAAVLFVVLPAVFIGPWTFS